MKPSRHQREAQGILYRRHRGSQVSLAVLVSISSVSHILDRLPMAADLTKITLANTMESFAAACFAEGDFKGDN